MFNVQSLQCNKVLLKILNINQIVNFYFTAVFMTQLMLISSTAIVLVFVVYTHL